MENLTNKTVSELIEMLTEARKEIILLKKEYKKLSKQGIKANAQEEEVKTSKECEHLNVTTIEVKVRTRGLQPGSAQDFSADIDVCEKCGLYISEPQNMIQTNYYHSCTFSVSQEEVLNSKGYIII